MSGRYQGTLALVAVLLVACRGESFIPTAIGDGNDHQSGTTGGSSPLVGNWQAVTTVTDSGGNSQTTTNSWQFASDGTCTFSVTANTGAATGTTISRPCTYADNTTQVHIAYTDDGTTADLSYVVTVGSPRHLTIDGVEYTET